MCGMWTDCKHCIQDILIFVLSIFIGAAIYTWLFHPDGVQMLTVIIITGELLGFIQGYLFHKFLRQPADEERTPLLG